MISSNERKQIKVQVEFTRTGWRQFVRLNRSLGARFIRAFILRYELAAYLAEHEAAGVQLDTECQEVRYVDGVHLLLRKSQGIWYITDVFTAEEAYCASKQIPEKILIDLIAGVLGISPMLDDQEALEHINHIEMHPNNRVLFVFQDGHTEEHFWKDHSRRDSWDAEKRKKAAEKTKEQRKRRKEQTAQ